MADSISLKQIDWICIETLSIMDSYSPLSLIGLNFTSFSFYTERVVLILFCYNEMLICTPVMKVTL